MADDKKDRALEDAPDTPGGEKPEKVEDRPMVGMVTPGRLSRHAQGQLSWRSGHKCKAPGPFPARAPLRDDCSSAPLESRAACP